MIPSEGEGGGGDFRVYEHIYHRFPVRGPGGGGGGGRISRYMGVHPWFPVRDVKNGVRISSKGIHS